MNLYVCYGTFMKTPRPGGHPCGNAHAALKAAGHSPRVLRTYGWGMLPEWLNPPRRRHVKKLTGSTWVPVLELDDGKVVSGSKEIAAWAAEHPASTAARPT